MSRARRSARPTSSTWAARSCARSRGATTACRTATSRAARARTCATRSRPRAAAARPWAARTAYNRGQILYRAAEALESRGDELGVERARARGVDRRARPLRRLDRQAAAGARRDQPGGGAVPVLLAARADGRRRDRGAGGARAARPGRRARARARRRQHGRGGALRAASARRASTSARCSACPTCRAGSSTCSRGGARELAPALAAHRDLNAVVDVSGDGELGAEIDRLAADSVTRVRHAKRNDRLRGGCRRRARAARGGGRAEDRLASGRGMTRARAAAGSLVFLLVAPGVMAGVVPWLMTGWESNDWPLPVQALGALMIAAGVAVLLYAFGRFVVEGLGTSGAAGAARTARGRRAVPLRAQPDVRGGGDDHHRPGAAARPPGAARLRGALHGDRRGLRPLVRGADPDRALRRRLRPVPPRRACVAPAAASLAA